MLERVPSPRRPGRHAPSAEEEGRWGLRVRHLSLLRSWPSTQAVPVWRAKQVDGSQGTGPVRGRRPGHPGFRSCSRTSHPTRHCPPLNVSGHGAPCVLGAHLGTQRETTAPAGLLLGAGCRRRHTRGPLTASWELHGGASHVGFRLRPASAFLHATCRVGAVHGALLTGVCGLSARAWPSVSLLRVRR